MIVKIVGEFVVLSKVFVSVHVKSTYAVHFSLIKLYNIDLLLMLHVSK